MQDKIHVRGYQALHVVLPAVDHHDHLPVCHQVAPLRRWDQSLFDGATTLEPGRLEDR